MSTHLEISSFLPTLSLTNNYIIQFHLLCPFILVCTGLTIAACMIMLQRLFSLCSWLTRFALIPPPYIFRTCSTCCFFLIKWTNVYSLIGLNAPIALYLTNKVVLIVAVSIITFQGISTLVNLLSSPQYQISNVLLARSETNNNHPLRIFLSSALKDTNDWKTFFKFRKNIQKYKNNLIQALCPIRSHLCFIIPQPH